MTDGFVEFEVGTVDLRRGLQAVAPHVQPDPQLPDVDHEAFIHDGDPHAAGGSDCPGFRPQWRGLERPPGLSALEWRLQAPRS